MGTRTSLRRYAVCGSLVAALAVAACGGDGGGADADRQAAATTNAANNQFNASVASFDLAADGPQRFLVGLSASEGRVVSFGAVQLNFVSLGTKEAPQTEGTAGPPVQARWIPVPGQRVDPNGPGPRAVEPADGLGVYEAKDVLFDRPGFWGVVVTAQLGGRTRTAQASFEVGPEARIPGPGDEALRTVNLLPGAADAPPKAVDSRADGATVPDPELHRVTVADAVATGRPTLLVISTPVFCESRFCGPVTDAVEQLAKETGDRMHFVHIEVWRDFEQKVINKAAAEWIMPPGSQDANEPWAFLIGGNGRIVRRWDNVASEPDVRAAVQQLLTEPG